MAHRKLPIRRDGFPPRSRTTPFTTTWHRQVRPRAGRLHRRKAGTNVAVGSSALQGNLDGSSCTAIGFQSLYNSNQNQNVGIGGWAAYTTTSGTGLVAVGTSANYSNISGSYNTSLGTNALYSSLSSISKNPFRFAEVANTRFGLFLPGDVAMLPSFPTAPKRIPAFRCMKCYRGRAAFSTTFFMPQNRD
jgi:hypothetical protein